jgi:tetratricopeptide (TPR) repeat protein
MIPIEHMKFRIWSILTIVLFTLAVYVKSVNNDFINWDDDKLVYQNEDIKKLDVSHIKKLFSSFYVQMYQPLSSLTYAIEYHFFGINAKVSHFNNILLHVLNSILVFLLLFRLTRNNLVSWLTAILFAIHPMHTESVAWIAERKDLVYTFFYLLSLMFYVGYLEKGYNIKYLLISLLFFILSLFSKSAAVTLPLVLILLDWYKGRKLNIKNNLDKIPFFLLSLIFGIITLYSQLGFAPPKELYEHQSFIDRIFVASYSLVFYLFKFLIPVKLSALHPFPVKSSIFLPPFYYISFCIVILGLYLLYRYRNRILPESLKRDLWFGLIFFICCISIVLTLPVGAAVVAERYSYVPYIGLMFVFSAITSHIYKQNKQKTRKILIAILGILIILFSLISFNRLSVWKERIVFWTDIIQKYPLKVPLAYHNRGLTYYRNGDYKNAINDFNVVISQKPSYPYTYSYRGLSKSALNEPLGAIADFSNALRLTDNVCEFYNNRGIEYMKIKNYDAAFNDFNSSIRVNPNFPDPYSNIGLLFLETGRPMDAISYFSQAIEISPKIHEPYYNRGLAYNAMQEYQASINDYNKALALNNLFAPAYCDRGISMALTGNTYQALDDFNRAITIDPAFSRAYLNRGIAKINMSDLTGACSDFEKANNPPNEKATWYLEKYCRK